MAVLAAPRLLHRAPLPTPLPARLRPPPLRPGLIERPALAARLDLLTQGPLTLVAAPTGYGKTTLLARWVTAQERASAWVSLGPEHATPSRFWPFLAAALADAAPELTARPVGLTGLAADEQAYLLAGALGVLDDDLVLVLDGYEAVVGGPVEHSLERFLELAPETLHVVLSTRHEPELSLALRCSRRALGELRVDDLRLDEAETAAVVSRTTGRPADGDAVAALTARTEGWPAGVYLAALAARGSARPAELLAGFSGATRDVADYLRVELLDAQPDEAMRDFLLSTSVLERLSASLCDPLLGRHDAQAMLGRLARAGAFLVPLDDLGLEFRYQRTVGEFLRAELARRAPASLARLRRRAAGACERAGLFDEAEVHARSAGEGRPSADVLGRHALDLVRGGRTELFGRLLATASSAALVRRRPALEAELRRLDVERADTAALLEAGERVASLCTGLPGGPVTTLARASALAVRGYALFLSGRVAEAYDVCSARQPWAADDAPAAAAQLAAIASLAAGRLGLAAVAAPLARSSTAALRACAASSGLTAALAALADAPVLAGGGEKARAAERCEDAAAAAALDPPARALALLELARLRAETDILEARDALAEARMELRRCHGAVLVEELADEIGAELGSRGRRLPPTHDLSPAEQRVLRLLATKLTQREIASELYLSANTVKTHARVIYRKLDVSSRGDAVRAAHELNLV